QVTSCTASMPAQATVADELQSMVGSQMQTPPAFSAIKIDGQRLYSLARKGAAPAEIPARPVTIETIEILDLALPVVRARIACSAGTYIRSIARDLGKRLGCGGCLQSLVREASGPFRLSDSLTLDELCALAETGSLASVIVSPADVLDMQKIDLQKNEASRILKGQRVRVNGADGHVLATSAGFPIAVCRTVSEGWLQPEVVVADGVEVD